MPPAGLLRSTGVALAAGGVLTALLNLVLTPLVFVPGRAFVEIAASPEFLARQCASALAAALLLYGSIGLRLMPVERAARFVAFAFAIAFLGSALLLAWEWVDIFMLHELARHHPETLRQLEAAEGLGFYDLGGIIAAATFALGWLVFAVAIHRGVPRLRRGAVLVVAGFFAVPFLTAALGPRWGGAMGNLVLGAGWVLLGRGVIAASDEARGRGLM